MNDASALRWRPEKRSPLFRSRVVFFSFLILALFLYFLQVQPYSKSSFFPDFFCLVFIRFFQGSSKPTLKYTVQLVSPLYNTLQPNMLVASNDIHRITSEFNIILQINLFIASQQIVIVTHLHCRQMRFFLRSY